jgi:hypothetical protein
VADADIFILIMFFFLFFLNNYLELPGVTKMFS